MAKALVVVESPFRSLLPPLLGYIDALASAEPDQPVAVVIAGRVTVWLPSFGVAAARVVKVEPPFVVRRISTVAKLNGAAFVPATFHDTPSPAPPAALVAVFWLMVAKPTLW